MDANDWAAVSAAAAVAGPIVGALAMRWVEDRPRLAAYFGHVSDHLVRGEGRFEDFHVHTHAIVIRNLGRKPATNVRVIHPIPLPNYMVVPSTVKHRVEANPGGGEDIVFDSLVRNEEVYISYLYYPPMIYRHVHAGVKCDTGFATHLPMAMRLQIPTPLKWAVGVFAAIGLATACYAAVRGIASLTS